MERIFLQLIISTKKIKTKDKWNQINVLDMQSMLVHNCRMPLLHMSKSYIWIEGKNQCINEFLLGIWWIQIYTGTNLLKSKWKYVSETHLVQIPLLILIQYYWKKYKSDIISYFLWEWENQSKENVQSVELCNIYYYWQILLYWLFRYREK